MGRNNPKPHELDAGQLAFMWNALRMGYQQSNIPALKELCDQLRQSMIQMTNGMRPSDPEHYVNFGDIGTIVNSIVIETMCLYLSGDLDKLETLEWTPVSERLPEEGGKYLCCWGGKTVSDGHFINGHFRLYGEIKDHLITAWMPLPKPYMEEQNENTEE